jgi:hypothetical protein
VYKVIKVFLEKLDRQARKGTQGPRELLVQLAQRVQLEQQVQLAQRDRQARSLQWQVQQVRQALLV